MTDEELEDIKSRLKDVEEKTKQGNSVGVLYSRLQAQLDELSLQVEGLIQSLQELPPEIGKSFEESCNKLRKKREGDAPDYSRW